MTNTTRTVVSNREANLYDDSYFYTTYHNEGQSGLAEFEEVMVGSTAFAGGFHGSQKITASEEVLRRYFDVWLTLKSKYDARETVRIGSKVTAPKARKYKSMGVVIGTFRSPYDTREIIATVEFVEGTAHMNINKLVKFQEFIQDWETS